MCGFAALFCASGTVPDGAIEAMTQLVRHRGPDGEGYAYFEEDGVILRGGPDTPANFTQKTPARYAPRRGGAVPSVGAAFGHRRLSIIDLSPSGHQPMCDASERYWITYNGEIYNFPELRDELEKLGDHFVSNSDTEVLLAAFAQWGLKALERLNGMFAFVLYDRNEKRIFAVRDRFGVKPLYWWQGPVGTGLSGGLDSSSIVCAVGKLLGVDESAHHNSFSARSDDPDYDEGEFIEEVVARTGVRHQEVRPEAGDALAGLPDLTWYQDEPFGAASVFAQWRVFGLAAKAGIKVTLDGHGSDEYLAGYHTVFAARLRELVASGRLIKAFREYAAIRARHGTGAGFLVGHMLDGGVPDWLRNMLRRARGLTVFDPDWLSLDALGAAAGDPCTGTPGGMGTVTQYSIRHLSAYGLPQMLHWSDRSSMAVSVESREPFLDHHLVRFALSLPSEHKVLLGVTKRVLRSGLEDIPPEKISNRVDKKGFITPEERWVTQDKRDEFLAAIRDAVSSSNGIFTGAALVRFEAMIEGRLPYHSSLWRMISFAAWMKRFSVQVP